jgi:hypothetical protein
MFIWKCKIGGYAEREKLTNKCTDEARRGIIWWKIGVWRLNGVMRNSGPGIWPICSKKTDATY